MKKILQKIIPLLIGKQLELIALFSTKKAHNKAFTLFCTPLRGKVTPEQKDFLDLAKDHILTVEGIQIQTYRWTGSKDTILLIHGWDSNTHRWKVLIQGLQEHDYNIIALDAPAQGNSSGKILNVPLYTECVQKAIKAYQPSIVIGHSVGGMTTIFNQYKYPNSIIKKLVILGPPSELSLIMKGYQRTLGLSNKFMKSLDQFFKDNFGFYYHEFSIAEFAKYLKQEGLVIHDKLDKIAPFNASRAIHKNWPNSKLMATEGLGHSLYHESINIAIMDFLKV